MGALSGYGDKILLVGINYDLDGKDKKHHTCTIEEYGKETIRQLNVMLSVRYSIESALYSTKRDAWLISKKDTK